MLNKTPESMKPDFNKEVKKRRNVFSYETKPIAVAGRECLVLCNQIAADDILILIKDSKMINDIISKINEWLKQNRNLTLNLNKTIANRVSLGIKFLGSRLYKYYKIPSKILFNKIKLSSKKFKRNIFDQNLFASVNSYLGLNSLFNIYSFCSGVLNNNRLDLIYDNETTKIVYL